MRRATSARRRGGADGGRPGAQAALLRPAAGRTRTCAGCRQRRPAESLVALAGAPRRAYVCMARACLTRALAAGGDAELAHLAKERLLQMVGLARRGGLLAVGLTACQALAGPPRAAAEAEGRALILVAPEVPEARRARLAGATAWPAAELARAAGLEGARVVAIRPGRLAAQAAYWLRLWYECAPRQPSSADAARPEAAGARGNTTAFEVGR